MKHITFTLLLTLSIIFAGFSQNLTLEYPVMVKEGSVTIPEMAFNTPVYNNTSSTMNLRWRKISQNYPGNWATKVCDDGLCYDTATSAASYLFPLAPGDTTYIIGYVVFDGVTSGSGTAEIVIYDLNDSAASNTVFTFTYNGWPVGINDPETVNFSAFPNPATDYLNIEAGSEKSISSVAIYDLAGRMVMKEINTSSDNSIRLNILNLSEGTYFYQLLGKDEEVIGVEKFIKL